MDIIALDIETTPFGMCYPEITLIGLFDGVTEIFFDERQPTINYLFNTKKSRIIIAHNLQFDYTMLFDYFESCIPLGWMCDTINVNGQFPKFAIFSKVMKYKDENNKTRSETIYLYFIDLMNYAKAGLGLLMKIYCPQYHKTMDFGIERNRNDIMATYDIYVNHYFKFYNETKPHLSLASIAFNDLLDRTGYTWLDEEVTDSGETRKHRPLWLQRIERLSYRGGIVFPNPRYIGQEIPGCQYQDINGLYAFVMRDLKVADSYLGKYTYDNDHQESKDLLFRSFHSDNTFSLFFIKCETTEPILPSRSKEGKLTLPIGKIVGWYCENELYHAVFHEREKIKNLEILREIRYHAVRGYFAPFINHWNGIKEEIDSERLIMRENNFSQEDIDKYRNIERKEAKDMCNSAYGRFGMRRRVTVIILPLPDKILSKYISKVLFNDFRSDEQKEEIIRKLWEHETYKDIIMHEEEGVIMNSIVDSNGVKYSCRVENGIVFLETILEEESENAVTIVASSITAGAHAVLMKNFHPIHTIYTDTDSQVRKGDPIIESSELGGWKVEKEGTVIIYGKKDYVFDGKRKTKGIPRFYKQLDLHTFQYLRVIRPREAKRRKVIPFTQFTMIKKLHYEEES